MAEKTTAVQIVMPQHCNGYARPRLFGGQIMAASPGMRRITGTASTTCAGHSRGALG